MANPGRWINTELPYFPANPKVYVCAGGQYGLVTRMFAEVGFVKANSPEQADLIVFTGGSDVSPEYYGQTPIPECGMPDRERDRSERAVFRNNPDTPKLGICRGAQFLHVMCGGELWQHVNNHTQTHLMRDTVQNCDVMVSSTHHQMMKFNDKMNIIGITPTRQATVFKDASTTLNMGKETTYPHPVEVEVCTYDKEKVLCIQGHPEYGPKEFTSWSMRLIRQWLPANSDTYTPETEAVN